MDDGNGHKKAYGMSEKTVKVRRVSERTEKWDQSVEKLDVRTKLGSD